MSDTQQLGRGFSDDTLGRTPGRVLKFLGYVGRTRRVFLTLARIGGMTQGDLDEGWDLLQAVARYVPPDKPPQTDPSAARALAELDAWDEPNLRRFKAALTRLHPDEVEKVFKGIGPGTGTESILSVSTFLDRVDDLEKEGSSVVATPSKSAG